MALGRTIVIFGTKGGVGKTVVAVNLASCLSAVVEGPIALIDLDVLAVGDLTKMLRVNPKTAIADLVSQLGQAGNWKGVDLSRVVTPIGALHVLSATRNPRQATLLDAHHLDGLFAALRVKYPYVIIDGGKVFTDILAASLDQANLILLVLTPDIVALAQSKWALETIGSLLLPTTMPKAILNRAGSHGSVPIQDVRAALGCELIAEIPSDGRAVSLAMNQGIPLSVSHPRAKITDAFRQLAELLVSRPDLYVVQRPAPSDRPRPLLQTAQVWTNRLPAAQISAQEAPRDAVAQLKEKLHAQLLERLDLRKLDLSTLTDPRQMAALRQKTECLLADLLASAVGGVIPSYAERAQFVKEVADEALGLGPLEELLADPGITDILVNNKDQIYVERHGKLELTGKRFVSDEQVRTVIERIVAPLGRRIDEFSPMVDARLPDGSRVNAIIPPLSLQGPMLSIRKFARQRFSLEDLIRFGTLTPGMAEFLKACVLTRKNMIVSGGTGSGKTTFLNVLSAFIPSTERILTIEDAAELKLAQTHWARLESRPPNIEGTGAVTIRDLFRNVLRMRPDRILIGECRGAETLDMLQAMNTGHDGSLTTVHANSPRDVITRLDSMVLMSNIELPIRAIREMVASAVHILVHTARLSDGSRKITSISELVELVNGMDIVFHDLFVFRQTGVTSDGTVLGEFVPTGTLPTFFHELKVKGIELDESIFQATEAKTS